MDKKKASCVVEVNYSADISKHWPSFIKRPLHPELHQSGAAKFDLNDLKKWLHCHQTVWQGIEAEDLYESIAKGCWWAGPPALCRCLNIYDGLAIAAKGSAVYRKYFGCDEVFLWCSTAIGKKDKYVWRRTDIRHEERSLVAINHLITPVLWNNVGDISIRWAELSDNRIRSECPTYYS